MSLKEQSPFELLRNKDIIQILDGDTKLGDYRFNNGTTVEIAMPYQSGQDLCNLSNSYGFTQDCRLGLSRWKYLDNLFEYCITKNSCSNLLVHLFNRKQFSKVLVGYGVDEIDNVHKRIVETVINKINGILSFDEREIVVSSFGFCINEINSKVEVKSSRIKQIDRKYIQSISSRAMKNVDLENYDTALTQSRTLLEEVFYYVIEKKKVTPSDSGNIGVLYKQVKELYNMHANVDRDRRINTLLSGFEKIISAISEMRNRDSDSHGLGQNRVDIDEHHACLFVNSAMIMADFILSVANKANNT